MANVSAVKRGCSLCELLGMNANVPTDICFSFAGLMRRGGATGPHRDGWGIALYEGNGCRTFHDPKPSAHSEIARFVREYPIKSRIVICHIIIMRHLGEALDAVRRGEYGRLAGRDRRYIKNAHLHAATAVAAAVAKQPTCAPMLTAGPQGAALPPIHTARPATPRWTCGQRQSVAHMPTAATTPANSRSESPKIVRGVAMGISLANHW
jgi:hypothetical protein